MIRGFCANCISQGKPQEWQRDTDRRPLRLKFLAESAISFRMVHLPIGFNAKRSALCCVRLNSFEVYEITIAKMILVHPPSMWK